MDINIPKGPLDPHFSAGEGGPGVNASMYAPVLADTTYVLNNWAQGTVKAMFSNHPNLLSEPTTSSEIDEGYFLGDDRRNRGIWHIARSQADARGVVSGVSVAFATKKKHAKVPKRPRQSHGGWRHHTGNDCHSVEVCFALFSMDYVSIHNRPCHTRHHTRHQPRDEADRTPPITQAGFAVRWCDDECINDC